MSKQIDLYGKTVYRLIDPAREGRGKEMEKLGFSKIPRDRGGYAEWRNAQGEITESTDMPRTRNSDPVTSHEAEALMRNSRFMSKQQDLVLDLLRQNPGSTARELDKRFILDGVAHRRLIELERKGLVVRGEPRTSKWHERRAITWRAK